MRRGRGGWRAAALGVAVAAVGGAAAGVRAPCALGHGDASPNVVAVLDARELPAALRGMQIEVHRTVAPQLVLENATGRTVEVLDADGVPFLRIGPGGVEGNLAATTWYATYAPGSGVPRARPASASGGTPRWQRVRSAPAFGWFDPRLDASAIAVPHRAQDAGRAADVGRWRIPLRVDGERVAIAGRFRFEPPRPPPRVRLTSPAEVAAGVRVKLLPGAAPGLLLESDRADPVVVLGEGGEPFLRLAPTGAEGNACSPTFRASGRAAAGIAAIAGCATGEERWQRLAAVPRIGWIEPRAAPRGEAAQAPAPGGRGGTRSRRWHVPIAVGDARADVSGVTSVAVTP